MTRFASLVAVAALSLGLALGLVAPTGAIGQPVVPPSHAPGPSHVPATAYALSFDGLMTDYIPLRAYSGKVLLVVNTASRCGFRAQLGELQALYTEFGPAGLVVIGVPSGDFMNQEFAAAKEIADFCQLNYGVTFPMAARSSVIGDHAHPFDRWAQAALGDSAVPRWNFHKVLVGRDGRAIAAFPTRTSPSSPEFRAAIQAALQS